MPIPDYQTLMLPLLRFLSDEKEHKLEEAIAALSEEFGLTPNERQTNAPQWPADGDQEPSRLGADLHGEGWSN